VWSKPGSIKASIIVLPQQCDSVCNREMPFQSRIKIERCVPCSRFGERRERVPALRRKSGLGRFFRRIRRYLETPGKPSVGALLLNASLATARETGTMHSSRAIVDVSYCRRTSPFPIHCEVSFANFCFFCSNVRAVPWNQFPKRSPVPLPVVFRALFFAANMSLLRVQVRAIYMAQR